VPALDAQHLAWWALQFTPRVALLEDAVVMEVAASERLFGGREALWERVRSGALSWQAQACAAGHTALGALALARGTHAAQDLARSTQDALRALPLATLSAVARHAPTLCRLGCQSLGQVRQLPRGGLSRRFGADMLRALDQAFGDLPMALDWVTLPPSFDARLELPGRVDTAPGLQFAALRLLQEMCAWLAGMHAGVSAFTLSWTHDGRRHDAQPTAAHTVRLGSPSREFDRLQRLLNEHLQRITLAAPVTDLRLQADEVQRFAPDSLMLFQTPGAHGPYGLSAQADALLTPAAQRAQRDALLALLDKLSVRLGGERVRQGHIVAEHRLEHAQHWSPAVDAALAGSSLPTTMARPAANPRAPAAGSHLIDDVPQPCWVLPKPQPLSLVREPGGLRERPCYMGPLQLLAGPHRVEAGWWDDTPGHAAVARDYYLASSAQAGLLWIYKARSVRLEGAGVVQDAMQDGAQARPRPLAASAPASPWFLHGLFA
jgi:protein ImuB